MPMFSIPTSCKQRRGRTGYWAWGRAHVIHHRCGMSGRAGSAHQEREDQHRGNQQPLQVGPESKRQESAVNDDESRGVPAGQDRSKAREGRPAYHFGAHQNQPHQWRLRIPQHAPDPTAAPCVSRGNGLVGDALTGTQSIIHCSQLALNSGTFPHTHAGPAISMGEEGAAVRVAAAES